MIKHLKHTAGHGIMWLTWGLVALFAIPAALFAAATVFTFNLGDRVSTALKR